MLNIRIFVDNLIEVSFHTVVSELTTVLAIATLGLASFVSSSLSLITKPRLLNCDVFAFNFWLEWIGWFHLGDKHFFRFCDIEKQTCLLAFGSHLLHKML